MPASNQGAATDAKRSYRLSTPLGKDKLLITRVTAHQRLGEPYRIDVALVSDDSAIAANSLLGQPVSVACELPDQSVRHLHGFVTDFRWLGQATGARDYTAYELTLRPWFWFLTQTSDCRVFQDLTVREIFEKVVSDLGFSDFRFDLNETYPKLAYCVQYRETAFNFLSRLLEHEGIYYFFEHTDQKHTMVLVDDSSKHKTAKDFETVRFDPTPDSRMAALSFWSWAMTSSVCSGAYASTDYDPCKPKKSLLGKESKPLKQGHASLEVFEYGADLPVGKDDSSAWLQDGQGARLQKVRLQEMQAAQSVAQGEGNAIGLAPGHKFTLKEHPYSELNMGYLVVGTRLNLTQNPHETGQDAESDANISMEAIDVRIQFRSPRTAAKPVIHGAQTATVVGKQGEEIDTDELGRIKVQFHWDRVGKKDEKSSCRVRVGQHWAGKQWGAIFIPRIGQEVIVSFLEGDPDRPLVTGSVYNGEQKPPYTLPANATQSGVKTRSAKDGDDKTFNEIRFEDKKGSEAIHIHAQKDMTVDIENDGTWRIGLDEDSAKTGKGKASVTIGNTAVVKIDESLDLKVTNKFVKVDAGDEITLVTGQSKIVMKKDGTITVECVNLKVKAQNKIEMKATNAVELEGLQAKIEAQTTLGLKGAVSAKLEGMMVDINATGIASLKGVLTKIG